MIDAIMLREHGEPAVLRLESVQLAAPAPNEVELRQTAIGVNFHDTYVRSGLYNTLRPPGIPGVEAVGVVQALGANVRNFQIGDRVGYVTDRYGGYAQARLIESEQLIRIPDDLDDRKAAAMLVKGLTAWMLLCKVRRLAAGETCLVHAAAGGVGRILCQWAAHLGAIVIGTVGSEEKARIALANGCQHVILYRKQNVPERVRELTNGRGVDVVYDSVGRDTFSGSLQSLAMRGHLINFGQSSGHIEPFAVRTLAERSATLSRPIVFHYIAAALERQEMAEHLFAAVRAGVLSVEIGAEFALKDAAEAHRLLESRRGTGSTLLVP